MTTQYDQILSSVRESLATRDARRDALAMSSHDVDAGALGSAGAWVLDLGDVGRLEYRVPVGDCSQWADRIDHPRHRGDPHLALVSGGTVRSLGDPPDVGYFDGANMQHQHGPTRDETTGERVRPATVAQLRAVARVLPAAVAELLASRMERAQRQAEDADAALAKLAHEVC